MKMTVGVGNYEAKFGTMIDKAKTNQVVTPLNRVILLDVSDIFRPENEDHQFRTFDKATIEKDPIMSRVHATYVKMHNLQTVDFVERKRKEWLKFDHAELSVFEALDLLNNVIDESDPDSDVPNILHAFQTAERIRQKHPDEDWFHLTGLIHDLGKILAMYNEPHFAVCGDTFAVGCEPGASVVFRDCTFEDNVDLKDPRYNTKYGMYEEKCGLDKLNISWGHDEYLYRVLKNHPNCTLPVEGLYCIRFHSFYPWHSGGDYWQFADDFDHEMFYWIKEFNKFDLYSKTDDLPNIEALKEYYQSLIDKYIPGTIKF